MQVAGRGPAPKRSEDRVRSNVDPVLVPVVAGGVFGPVLPVGVDWPEATVVWWDVWRGSAIAGSLGDSDWSFLLDTAVLHAAFWGGNLKIAAELRLRVAKFGATPEDRLRLRIEVVPVGSVVESKRVRSAHKDRLLRSVSGD